ncbi:MAG: hypothetical protein JNL46_05185 [Sphingosinicella sp.]|nr:hypothetical protein [Sphingosinicella sp.]
MALPDPIDMNGEWVSTLNRLYTCFLSIFYANPRLLANGRLLVCDGRCLDDNKEEGFWHIISKTERGERLPDYDRARCMPWIPAMLNGTAPGISRWRYQEGSGAMRQYYWLEEERYVLILEEGRNVTSLVTAYYVQSWGAKDLERRRAKGAPF